MSALILRIIACVAMLLDHIGYINGNLVLRAIGRIAFPIFVYLLYNGFTHTSCRWRYALRLGIFAVISQIPFSLLCTNTLTHQTGNVFFTLLAGLLCIWSTDLLRGHKVSKWLCWLPTVIFLVVYKAGWIQSDYGGRGIVLAIIFYLFDGKKWWQRMLVVVLSLIAVFYNQLTSMVIALLLHGTFSIPQLSRWELWQLFSLGALPLIFLYNGKRGPRPSDKVLAKLTQISFYLFYPLHMIVLWLLTRV